MSLPEKMYGVVLTGHGGQEALEWRDDLPLPILAKQDVLIQVAAAAVNNTDIYTRTAWYSKGEAATDDASWSGIPISFPRVQGADVCGRIVAVGAEVERSRIGERVIVEPCIRKANDIILPTPWYFGSECDGGFAQFTRIASCHAHAVHSDLTDVELASFPCAYSTAENMLTRAGVRDRETVLITGASGGVGSATVQLACARGAKVVAVTSLEKAKALTALGATKTLNRNDNYVTALGRNAVDVVIDLVAGEQWASLLDVLRPGGRYAVAGAIARPLAELDIRTLYLKDLSLLGCTVLDPNVFGALIQRIENKDIKPLIAKCFPLKEIKAAQRIFADKTYVGKIVLKLG